MNTVSFNWSGARVKSTVQGRTFNSVWASWTVPSLARARVGDSEFWHAECWVGLDGGSNANGYSTDMLQAGIKGTVDNHQNLEYQPFYRWKPDLGDGDTTPIDIRVRAGDHISVKVRYYGGPSGSFEFHNHTTDDYFSDVIRRPDQTNFRGDTVEWVVERSAPDDKNPQQLAHFGGMDFIDAGAERDDNSRVSPNDGEALDMQAGRTRHEPPRIIARATAGPDRVHIERLYSN